MKKLSMRERILKTLEDKLLVDREYMNEEDIKDLEEQIKTVRKYKKKEKWKVFYHKEKELCAYTLYGTFEGEEQATKELLAAEKNININDIQVKIEER